MAYEYDQLGNIIGEYETEEERRIREAANQPVKQSITYNPDGTREMTIKGTPEALSPINPNTPTFTAPQQAQPQPAPQQAPSREQQRTQTLQAEQAKIQQQLQSTQDPAMIDRLRRDFMAVQNELTRGQGQRVPSVRQTMGNMASSLIPSAQAQPVPQQPRPIAPQALAPMQMQTPAPAPQPAQQQSMYSLGTGQTGQGIKAPQLGQAPTAGPVFDFYQQFQDNPRALISMAYTNQDVAVPDWMRDRMKNRASELITQQRELENAKSQIPTMSENDIARTLRQKTTGGNYLKAMLFNTLGMTNSAMEEAAKLGIGKEIMTTINGQPAMVKIANNGTPIEGLNAVTGKKLSAQELVIAAQSATVVKGTEVEAGTYMDPTGKVAGNWVLERRPGGSQYRQVGSGKIATEDQANSLRKTGVQGTLTDQRARQIQDINLSLQGKGVEEQMRILSAYNSQLAASGYPIVQPNEVGINVPQIGGAQTQVPTQVPTQAQTQGGQTQQQVTPVVPTQLPPAGARNRPTGPKLAATAEELKQQAQEVGTQKGKVEAKTIAQQGFADSTYPLLSAVREEISKSTGSSVGASVDSMARAIGATTKGQEAIAKLNILAGPIKMNIPRFEGAQSDRDVQEYARQAGDFANPKLTVKERLAALSAMETLLSKYDKAGNNDWTFGRGQAEPGVTSSGNKYKKVQ